MKAPLAFLLVAFACVCFVAAEEPNSPWRVVGRASPSEEVSIVVYLRQNQEGLARLESLLLNELANPEHENYGMWRPSFEGMGYTAPPLSAQSKVGRFLESTGMESKVYGDFARLSGMFLSFLTKKSLI